MALDILVYKTGIKKSDMSGIKGSVCLSTTDRRVSVTPWLGEPPCDPNPPARPKAFSNIPLILDILVYKTGIKKSDMSGIKGSVCLSTTDRRVSATPWLGEPPCEPNPPTSTKGVLEIFF